MSDFRNKLKHHKNEKGFTLIELLIASVLSVLMIGLIAGVFTSQKETFVLQDQLNSMQTSGRAATEFLSRAVANAGYNVFRGTRFLAASDHYLTAVYDKNNDGVIQNDEVVTYGLSNATGSPNETFNIDPYFDQDQDGDVEGTETATYPINMTLTAPPYNIYKVLPDNSGTGTTRHLMARNIDNLIIRYYDKNGDILPASADADDDGIYDSGAYTLAISDMNEIRKVEVEVLARTKDEDPRDNILHSGTYPAGSAATLGGSSTYNDGYYRELFTAYMAPRNLVMAPWGKMDVVAAPEDINCPNTTSTVTATLVDSQGVPVSSGINIDFALSGSQTATLSPTSVGTDIFGQASTTVTYDWSSPNASITVSASSLITSGGDQNPVFNAGTVNFQSGTGTFTDDFNGGLDPNWVELDSAADMFPVDVDPADGTDDGYQMSATGLTRAVNGCQWQKYGVQFDLTPSVADIDAPAVNVEAIVGGYLRYVDANNNYSVLVEKQTSANCLPGDGKGWCLKLVKWNGVSVTELAKIGADFALGTKYTILAEVEDDNLRAKIWPAALGPDPNPGVWAYDVGFPTTYPIATTDSDYAGGQVGFIGDWTNGANVVFDGIAVTPIT